MSAVALKDILHQGRVIEPGSVLPEGVDVDRLVRLGCAHVEDAKPKRATKPKAEEE